MPVWFETHGVAAFLETVRLKDETTKRNSFALLKRAAVRRIAGACINNPNLKLALLL